MLLYHCFVVQNDTSISLYFAFTRDAVWTFADGVNDHYGAEVVEVEVLALIDNYGFGFHRRELPDVWPNRFADFSASWGGHNGTFDAWAHRQAQLAQYAAAKG